MIMQGYLSPVHLLGEDEVLVSAGQLRVLLLPSRLCSIWKGQSETSRNLTRFC
jgi:hypothetical protein